MLPAFVERVPEYEVRDGRMHIVTGGDLEIVMPVEVFECAHALASEALAKWRLSRLESGKVLHLPRRRT